MRLLALVIMAVGLGAGSANAQTYFQWMDKCRNSQSAPVETAKACDTALSMAQPDATADRAMILLYRSHAYLAAKDFNRAMADADASNAIMNNFFDTENMRCWVRAVANKDLPTGRVACDNAIRMQPGAAIFDTSGTLALQEGNWLNARGSFDGAFSRDKTMVSAQYGRGLARIALGETVDGEADLRAASAAKADFDSYGLTQESVKARAAANPKPSAN
jgi:hypothetical protein